MKYGCPSNLGMKMKISLYCMILDMGISLQPLQDSYKNYEQWITPSCLKYLWDKCDWFDVMVEFNDTPLELPRCGYKWLMREFLRCGFSADGLRRLNIVCIHMQVLFLSDILSASGKILDGKNNLPFSRCNYCNGLGPCSPIGLVTGIHFSFLF